MKRILSLLACLGVVCGHATAADRKPNIIFIVADDLGYGEAGCYGGKEIPTPNIDALAASGARFTNGYVTAPLCAPSRAALMTARYQTRFGFEFNTIGATNAKPGIGLPVAEKTIADRLRGAGYATSIVGKWHLGGTPEFHPMRRGFDEFFGFLHEGHFYVPPPWQGVTTWLRRTALPGGGQGRWTSPDERIVWSTQLGYNEPEYDADNPLLRESQPVAEPTNLTDAFAREAQDFIGRHRTQPFFLYLAFNAVHSPMQGADAYMKKFEHISNIQRRIFAAMLANLDDSIGRVLAQLREYGLEENTLIVFLSDNGGPTEELTSSNAPLRGGKGDLWEGGIRIPYIVSWKGHVPAGRVVDAPVISMDLGATAFDAAGVSLDAAGASSNKAADASSKKTQNAALDGVSLLPLLTDKSTAALHESLFWRLGKKNALRHGDWKLIRLGGGAWKLFDLAHDVSETTDLAARDPARVQELSAIWDHWNAEQIEPLWK